MRHLNTPRLYNQTVIVLKYSIAEQLIMDKTTNYEKSLALHDWICSYMYYDVDSLASDEAPPYYATDIVKSRKAVSWFCNAYGVAVQKY